VPPAADRARADALLRWYADVARDLPWRRTRDPYRILVSEVMLQQTQAERVVPYYRAFIARFPDADRLAAAPLAAVLAAWSGLGYNRRAVALQRAAAVVATSGWPRDAAGLQALPGVGPYTAAAVASFAFGERVAAVDTNVRRVIERWDRRARTPGALQRRAQRLLEQSGDEHHASWNQALMELGATVCRARAADCVACPVASGCRSDGRPVRPRAQPNRLSDPFEETDRYVRGRVVAALVDGVELPGGIASARIDRALEGLHRDGLVDAAPGGGWRLPGAGSAGRDLR
jgi:A/G-specific adenine glycosylase